MLLLALEEVHNDISISILDMAVPPSQEWSQMIATRRRQVATITPTILHS